MQDFETADRIKSRTGRSLRTIGRLVHKHISAKQSEEEFNKRFAMYLLRAAEYNIR